MACARILAPFLTFTGDYRDLTATAGMSPGPSSWLAAEGSYGNGFLDRLEHRKQFKFNGGRTFHAGDHTITLFGIGYLGYGYVAGLRPIYGFNAADAAAGWVAYPDTIDPRQKDQTHTALAALNDEWKLGSNTDLQLSGFFRTYNLSLFSDFGLGLIRQSEFRTVGGASADYVKTISTRFTLLAGADYEREAPRRDDLDHYNFFNPAAPNSYGPFVKIDGNNVTIAPVSPYIAAQGGLGSHFDYYAGWRRDEIFIDNQDLIDACEFVEQAGWAEFAQGDADVRSEERCGSFRVSRSALASRSSRKIRARARRSMAPQPSIRLRPRDRINWSPARPSTKPM